MVTVFFGYVALCADAENCARRQVKLARDKEAPHLRPWANSQAWLTGVRWCANGLSPVTKMAEMCGFRLFIAPMRTFTSEFALQGPLSWACEISDLGLAVQF